MYTLKDMDGKTGVEGPLFHQVSDYIRKKNLNFIVARGKLVNQSQDAMDKTALANHLKAYAACDFSMVSIFNKKPCPPFIAADMDLESGRARVSYIIDLTREAQKGDSSPFYSKILGAFATQFFTASPGIKELWFPFSIQDTVGRGLGVMEKGNYSAITLR